MCKLKTLRLISLLTISSTFLFICCKDNSSIYVDIQFNPIQSIPDSAWLKIDEHTFLHTPHDFEWRSKAFFPNENREGDFCYLPTSRVFFYHPNNSEKRVMEKMTNFEICNKLGKRLNSIVQDSTQVYKILNPKELIINGVLRLQRHDGRKIEFSHSEDNPVYMAYKKVTQ